MEFCESMFTKLPEKHAKLKPSWVQGMWLGKAENLDEETLYVGNHVRRSRAMRRLPGIKRWDPRKQFSCTWETFIQREVRPCQQEALQCRRRR